MKTGNCTSVVRICFRVNNALKGKGKGWDELRVSETSTSDVVFTAEGGSDMCDQANLRFCRCIAYKYARVVSTHFEHIRG